MPQPVHPPPPVGRARPAVLAALFVVLLAAGACRVVRPNESGTDVRAVSAWRIHDESRPQPPVVTPGPAGPSVPPPSDAVVLFGGGDLSRWRSADSTAGPARWRVDGDAMEVAPGTGTIETRQGFGDVQLHVEWAAPSPAHGEGQERGNSGVYLMRTYEVQVLDSYHNRTYPDGQAGAVYGQYPPLVNASRPPGEWQTYDIVFHAPRWDSAGVLRAPARLTLFHNGVLAQDDVVLTGPTAHGARPPYQRHPDRLPIQLQDHGQRVRFRNIWVRELRDGGAAKGG